VRLAWVNLAGFLSRSGDHSQSAACLPLALCAEPLIAPACSRSDRPHRARRVHQRLPVISRRSDWMYGPYSPPISGAPSQFWLIWPAPGDWAFVKFNAQPLETFQQRAHRARHIALLIRVLDAQDHRAIEMPGEQIIKNHVRTLPMCGSPVDWEQNECERSMSY